MAEARTCCVHRLPLGTCCHDPRKPGTPLCCPPIYSLCCLFVMSFCFFCVVALLRSVSAHIPYVHKPYSGLRTPHLLHVTKYSSNFSFRSCGLSMAIGRLRPTQTRLLTVFSWLGSKPDARGLFHSRHGDLCSFHPWALSGAWSPTRCEADRDYHGTC